MKKPKIIDYVDDSMADAYLFPEVEGQEREPTPDSKTLEKIHHMNVQAPQRRFQPPRHSHSPIIANLFRNSFGKRK